MGPVEIAISSGGRIASLEGPQIVATKVPCGAYVWDDPLNRGIVVRVGDEEVTFSLLHTVGLPVVHATTGSATWLARRTSAYFFRWSVTDAQTGRPVVMARAWKGKVTGSPDACEVAALIIIWVAFLDRLFAIGPSIELPGTPYAGG